MKKFWKQLAYGMVVAVFFVAVHWLRADMHPNYIIPVAAVSGLFALAAARWPRHGCVAGLIVIGLLSAPIQIRFFVYGISGLNDAEMDSAMFGWAYIIQHLLPMLLPLPVISVMEAMWPGSARKKSGRHRPYIVR